MLTSLLMLTLIKHMAKTLVLRIVIDYSRKKKKKEKQNEAKTIRRNWEGGAGGNKRKNSQFGISVGLHVELVENKSF